MKRLVIVDKIEEYRPGGGRAGDYRWYRVWTQHLPTVYYNWRNPDGKYTFVRSDKNHDLSTHTFLFVEQIELSGFYHALNEQLPEDIS